MRVGWLADRPGYVGGAELTQAEFRAAAPEGVEIVDCPPGGVVSGLDRYVVHNHMTYSAADLANARNAVRYVHDMRPQLLRDATFIFCSPLQHERFPLPVAEGHLIPPPIDLARFRPNRQTRRNGKRQGACWVGRIHVGKGAHLAAEWGEANGGIDFWGEGPLAPSPTVNVRLNGPLPYEQVPQMLWQYERFVFLPTALEPFGRAVVEAWAAGCELVVNGNVGAAYWIRENPEKIDKAAEDFWAVVLGDWQLLDSGRGK